MMSNPSASHEKTYDAFISYRHLSPDQEIAEQVQKLLEGYRPPKALKTLKKRRIARIFRDRSELPTVGGLDEALKEALSRSDYLIVILSSKLQESKWCMEEIRTFKAAHGGKIDRILPILVEGEPDDVIPDILRHETREVRLPDGVETQEVELEPLCCDVRAETTKGSLKKLKTEFLRLAAPMLGVGYDDLYQRHMRRRRRIAIASVSATIAILVTVLSVISYFAYQTYQAQKRYYNNLVDTYTRQGASLSMSGDGERALLYYSEALRLAPQTQAAKTGALMLLQQQRWLNQEERIDGWILGDLMTDRAVKSSALDGTGEKELAITRDGARMVDREGRTLSDLTEYGDFIASAQNGSCWTFATEDTITFFFPADGSIAQVDRPLEINPLCDPEMAELNQDTISGAMAINRTRAAVCYGGYLYIYDLDERTARGTLNTVFDLGNVFDHGAQFRAQASRLFLEVPSVAPSYVDVWMDDGGYLAVLYDGSTAAVFNIGNRRQCNLNRSHTQPGRTLQSVAFSPDGQHYALVYGDGNTTYANHGGCLEVYDEFGELCLATDFEGNTPLKGAVFDPHSTRIAAWGSVEMQVWDWTTGEQLVPHTLMRGIDAAAWLEDGRLAVSNGMGEIGYHAIIQWTADASAPSQATEPELRTVSGNDLTLSTGYHFGHQTSGVYVADANGTLTDEQVLRDLDIGSDFIDHMILDVRHDTVYAWQSTEYSTLTALCAFKVDQQGKIASLMKLDTLGRTPLSLNAACDGVLMETGTGELFYYKDGAAQPSAMMVLETIGSVANVVSNDHGLAVLVINNTRGYTRSYSLWLCDLNKGLMLAQIGQISSYDPPELTFTEDGYLTYALGNETYTWRIDAPDLVTEEINALQSISCFRLGEAQIVQIVDTVFDPLTVDSWSGLTATPFDASASSPASEEDPLAEYDAETMLAAYRVWWPSVKPGSASLYGLCSMMIDCYNTALNAGLEGEIDDIIEVFFALISEDDDTDVTALRMLNAIINAVLYDTPENAEIVAGYYDRSAALYERRALEENDIQYLYSAYCNRVSAGLIRGQGSAAFQIGKEPLYSAFESAFLEAGMSVYQYLFSNQPQLAAQEFAIVFPEENLLSTYGDMLDELTSYVKLGILSEETYSGFVSSLSHPIGLRLTQLPAEQLDAGLQLGDVVVSVNGIYFGTPQLFADLRETMPTAPLEVIRNGSTRFTVQPTSDWVFVGDYDIIP